MSLDSSVSCLLCHPKQPSVIPYKSPDKPPFDKASVDKHLYSTNTLSNRYSARLNLCSVELILFSDCLLSNSFSNPTKFSVVQLITPDCVLSDTVTLSDCPSVCRSVRLSFKHPVVLSSHTTVLCRATVVLQ